MEWEYINEKSELDSAVVVNCPLPISINYVATPSLSSQSHCPFQILTSSLVTVGVNSLQKTE